MTNQYVNPWTDERIDLAKSMWTAGHSASAIADRLACGLTRNAVIGKITRLGMPKRATVTFHAEGGKIRTARTPKPKPQRMPRFKIESERIEPPAVFTTENFRTIGQLENEHCRFPCWDEGASIDRQFYCGSPADLTESRSFCAFHSRIAYTSPPPKKPRPYWYNERGDRAA